MGERGIGGILCEGAPAVGTALPSVRPPSSVGTLGLIRAFRSNLLDAFADEHFTRLRVSFRRLGREFFCLSDPDDIDLVFNAHVDHYRPNVLAQRILEPMAGRGLLLAEGEDWERQHRQLIPFFQPRHVEGLIPAFHDIATAAIASWPSSGGLERNLLADFRGLTLALIARCLLSIEDRDGIGRLADFVTEAERSGALLHWQDFVALSIWRGVRQPRRRLEFAEKFRVFVGSILDRRPPTERRGRTRDMLDVLRANEGRGVEDGLDGEEIIDQVVTMFTAGFTTTALAMFWTILTLAMLPDHQEAVRGELCQGDAEAAPDAQSLRSSRTAVAFLYETLRLYPPAYIIAREARQDDAIGDLRIPKGAAVIISPWVVHRHRALWRNPDRFDPERFLLGGRIATPRAWMAFGTGPRVCIGSAFATTEILVMLRCLLSRYRIELRNAAPRPIGRVTLVPEFQPLFRLTPR